MKILLINKFFYRKGGSESYFFDLAKLLEDHGHELIYFSMKDPNNKITRFNNFFVDPIDFTKDEGLVKNLKKACHLIYSFEAQKKLQKIIKTYQPDIAHLHNISSQLSPSILATLRQHKIPVVQTLHDYELICPKVTVNYHLKKFKIPFIKPADDFPLICPNPKYEIFMKKSVGFGEQIRKLALFKIIWLEVIVNKILGLYDQGVNVFITPSNFLKKKLTDWGQDQNKIIQLPNFLDLTLYQPNYNFKDYIIYSGRLAPHKGVLTLLEAMKNLPEINLKIAGDGPQLQEIKAFIERYDLKNVELLGYLPTDELQQVIRQSRLVIVPSVWHENYSMTLLEAAALGKPLIASNIGGNSEIVKDQFTGLLFEPGNYSQLAEKIKFLYDNESLIREMGQNARKQVEKENSSEQHYSKLMEIYKRAMDKI